MTGFTNADLTIANSTLSAVSSADGGITWTATLTPIASITDATNVITLANTGVTDAVGNAGTGTTDSNNYAIDTSAPTITSVSVPANATYATGQNLDFTVNTNENITVNTGGGTPRIALTVGATTRYADYLSGGGTSALLFRYTVQAGDNDADGIAVGALDPNGGTLRDAADNSLTLTLNSVGSTAAVLVDTAAPTATIVVADTALAAGETSGVTITFSEAVTGFANDDLTIANGTLSAVSSADGGITWTANLTPSASVTDATNVITLDNTGVTDAAGNSGTGTTDSNNYAVDTGIPTATIVVADTELNAGETSGITVTFNEAVTGFTNDDLTIENGSLSAVSSADGGITWTATLTPSASVTDATNVITLDNTGVTDAAGNSGTGTTDSNNYAIDTSAPAVTSVTVPSNGAYKAGESLSFTINTSEAVVINTGGGIPRLALTIGGATRYAAYTSGSGTDALVFQYTVQAGDNDNDGIGVAGSVDLNGGTARDAAGNNFNVTLNAPGSTSGVLVDTTAPTLSSSNPADGATDVQFDENVVLTFSEVIAAGSGADALVELYDEADNLVDSVAATSSNVSISGNSATVDFVATLVPNMDYYVQIAGTAFRDNASNFYAGVSDKTTLNFTVTNNAPAASDDTANVNEDQMVDIAVLGNDTDADSSFNAASMQVTSGPTNGSTSVDTGTGVITYTPTADYHGTDTFTYTVEDIHGALSNAATVMITVASVNDAPVASADLASTPEDNAVTIDVAANDSDIDSGDSVDSSTITIAVQPTNGSVTINGGQVDYEPDLDFSGSDSFTYTIEDQNGDVSNTATVVVNVTGVNDLPTAANDNGTLDEDDSVVIDVLANDSDLDGTLDATTVLVMTDAANGITNVDALTGAVTYTPDANYNGSDSFTYVVRDNDDGTSNAATVTLAVNSVNDAPVANADTAIVQEDVAYEINVLGNDSDIDGSLSAASVEVVTAAQDGITAIDTTTGAITYTPGAEYNGSDSFTYRVMDNGGLWSPAATVTLTIQQVNDAPLANDDTASTDEDTPVTIQILTNDTDVDGTLNTGTIVITSAPAHGEVTDNGDGTVNYAPDANYHGSDSFSYTVTDDEGTDSNTATVNLTINSVNDAPAISGAPPVTINEGAIYNFVPAVSDVDGDDLTFSINQAPVWASFDPTTGALTGTPGNGDVGVSANIVISVSDGVESVDLPSFNIDVLNVNEAPVIGGMAPTNATVGQLYSFAPVVSDADVGDMLSYSATGLPAWLSLNPLTGLVSGIPADVNVGSYEGIAITVSDGEESVSLAAFGIQVSPGVDGDGDNFSDYQESLDDTNPADPLDYYDLTPPVLTAPEAVTVDANALYTTVHLTQLLGLATDSSNAAIGEALADLVTDNVDGAGCCAPAVDGLQGGVILLPPGRNEVTWVAEDRLGNSVEVAQVVNVRPLVSLSKDQTTVEGASVAIEVILNGESPFYPLTVPFVVDAVSTADSADHDLISGMVTFTETGGVGQTRASIPVNITVDDLGEGDETLLVRLDDRTSNAEDLADGYDPANPDIFDINSGTRTTTPIQIVERNLAPEATLQLSQGGVNTLLVTAAGGPVTANVVVVDPNLNETHSFDWSATDNTLVDADGDLLDAALTFDPNGLNPGRHQVQVQVTDSEGATGTARLFFRVVEALPTLSPDVDSDMDGVDDQSEGTADSDDDGIANYLDNLSASNVLPEEVGETGSYLIECDPGMQCRLGRFALLGELGGVFLSAEDLNTQADLAADPGFEPVGGIFDFEIQDLPDAGQSVRVVIPQRAAIPEDAVYRKFQDGAWMTFVENTNNALHSAPGNPGYCPPPGDNSWEQGLVAGHLCVQITIEDGGPNDADGLANNAVEDPGAVSASVPAPPEPGQAVDRSIKSTGGGGAINGFFLILVGGLLLITRLGKGKGMNRAGPTAARNTLLSLLLVPVLLLSAERGHAQALDDAFNIELGFYQSVSAGSSGRFISKMANDGVTVDIERFDRSRRAQQFSVGYQFHSWAGVQLGYLDLGDVTVDLQAQAADVDTLRRAFIRHYPATGDGWTLSYRYQYPITHALNVTADLGAFFWKRDIDVFGDTVPSASNDGVDPVAALGVNYEVADGFSIGGRLQRAYVDGDYAELWGAVIGWRF